MKQKSLEAVDPFALELTPDIKQLYDELKQCEDLLNVGELSLEEAQELITVLEARWPYMSQPMRLSGEIFRVLPPEDGQPTPELTLGKQFVEDLIVESKGFWAYSTPVYQDDEYVGDRWRIGHFFYLGDQVFAPSMFLSYSHHYYGCAGLDESVVDLPPVPGGQGRRFEGYRPEVLLDIDELVLNAADEAAATLALGEWRLAAELDDTADYQRSIVEYVNGLIDYDRQLPYRATVDHFFIIPQPDDNPLVAECQRPIELVIRPGALVLTERRQRLAGTVARYQDDMVLALTGEILSGQADGRSANVLLPLENLTTFAALRQELYAGSDNDCLA